jgi:hypothetical protein
MTVSPNDIWQGSKDIQISVHVTNELACLIAPELRPKYSSMVAQSSPSTERYVDTQLGAGVEELVVEVGGPEPPGGIQIGVFTPKNSHVS